MTSMLKSGHVVGAINDYMTFFDISRVIRPADRIAWSLTKAAGDMFKSAADLAFDPEYETYPDISVLAVSMGPRLAKRAELLRKAAEIEKTINMKPATPLMKGVKPCGTEKKASLASYHSLPDMYRALADAGVCLPFEQWAYLTLGQTKYASLSVELEQARRHLNGAFTRALNDMDNVVRNSAYDPSENYPSAYMRKIASDLSSEYGLNIDQLRSRAIYNTISEGKSYKVYANSAGVKMASDIEGIIRNYITYKLAFLEHVENSDPRSLNHFMEACVAQNII
jgi:hypothetical protein